MGVGYWLKQENRIPEVGERIEVILASGMMLDGLVVDHEGELMVEASGYGLFGYGLVSFWRRMIEESKGSEELSDGYHTFRELYDHRAALVLALMKREGNRSWYSWRHADGGGYEGHFIVGLELAVGQVTYHLEAKYWGYVKATGARCLGVGREWDGHTSEEVWERLLGDVEGEC